MCQDAEKDAEKSLKLISNAIDMKPLNCFNAVVNTEENNSGINKAGAMRTASPCSTFTLKTMKTDTIKMATLNPFRAQAALQLAHIVRGGGKIDATTVNACASQHMKNATPGPMVVATITAECTRLLAAFKGKPLPSPDAAVRHAEWNADAVQPLPTVGKVKSAKRATAKRKLNK